jgi:hypothetical protein
MRRCSPIGSTTRRLGAWFVFLRALFGLPMSPEELALYRRCTARDGPPAGGAREAWLVCGRLYALVGNAQERRDAEGRRKGGRNAAPPSTEPDAKAPQRRSLSETLQMAA